MAQQSPTHATRLSPRILLLAGVIAGCCALLWSRQEKIHNQARQLAELTEEHKVLTRKAALLNAIKDSPAYAMPTTFTANLESNEGSGKRRNWQWQVFVPAETQFTLDVSLENFGNTGKKLCQSKPVVLPIGSFHLQAAVEDHEGVVAFALRIPDAPPDGSGGWSDNVIITDDPSQMDWAYRARDVSSVEYNRDPVAQLKLFSWSSALEPVPRPRITLTMVPVKK